MDGSQREPGPLSYFESVEQRPLDSEFDLVINRLRRYRQLGPETSIFEIGAGTGWFLIQCAQAGLRASGIELSQSNYDYALEKASREGVEIDLSLGTIEEVDIGTERHDVIVALSVFEHVQRWEVALERVFRALRPGGLFYFYSTNRFSLKSGEYSFPLYGWLPDRARYALRTRRQGPEIMSTSSIDFNQFTHGRLERAFREVGFSRADDVFAFAGPGQLGSNSRVRDQVMRAASRSRAARSVARTFAPGTCFICVK